MRRFETRLAKLERSLRPPRPPRGEAEFHAAFREAWDNPGRPELWGAVEEAMVLMGGREATERFNDQLLKIYGPTAAVPIPIP